MTCTLTETEYFLFYDLITRGLNQSVPMKDPGYKVDFPFGSGDLH
jgi:hypothetical protein